MKDVGIILLMLLGAPPCVLAGAQKQEWCDSLTEEREVYLKYPDQADYVPPTSNVQSPFELNASMDSLSASEVPAALSGYYCDSPNNHPLMYASSDGFTVIGVGFAKTYSASELNLAIEAYEVLLVSAGYVDQK